MLIDKHSPARSAARPLLGLLLAGIIAGSLVGCGDTSDPAAPDASVVPTAGDDTTDPALTPTAVDTFVLRAYGADAVYMAGNFNSWDDDDPAWAFTDQGDGYTWRLEIDMPAGLQQYKIVLWSGGQATWMTDPAAVEVLSGDPSQANAVYGRDVGTIRDLPVPIDRSQLVIYEISPNDFSAAGSFSGVIAGLTGGPDLVDLGVNAIELMPVTAPSYNGWGYDPSLYFAPNASYGWPNIFGLLVDRCHEQGIAVILDMVVNHAAGGSALRLLDEFSGSYNFTTIESNPWGMVELNWSDPALRAHIVDALLHWVETYKVDGFRFDYIAGEDWSTWEFIRDELRARHPDLLLIGEDYSYPNDGNSVTHGYDAQWGGNHTDGWAGGGNNFNQVMTTNLTQNGFAWRGSSTPDFGCWSLGCRNMWAAANVIGGNDQYDGANGDGFSDVKYLESHDENRIVWAVDTYGSAGAQAVGGLQKSELGAHALLTCVGIPMLYTGQEIGSGELRPADPTIYKIDWAAGDDDLRAVYRNLIRLRLAEPALQSENIWFHWRDGSQDHLDYTLCYWRGDGANSADAEIVVALNFDDEAHLWEVAFPADGIWHRYHPREGAWEFLEVTGGALLVDQAASSGIIWKRYDGVTSVPD